MPKSKSKKTPKWNAQMAEMIALSRITGYPIDVLCEKALSTFIDIEAPAYASPREFKKKAATVSDIDIEMWTPLWAVLQDGYDEAFGDEGPPEPGDPGSLGNMFEAIAKDAGVGLIYTLRAALYYFNKEQRHRFIADPHNLKYRLPTPEEEAALREVRAERQELRDKPGWHAEDDPLFHEKFRQRMNDAIDGLDAGIR
jgi:hypothetical protein